MTEIGPATAGELPAVEELLRQNALPVAGLAEHFDQALVARSASGLVGAAALELYGRDALLRSVVVAAGWRGQGEGERLVRRAIEAAREQGVASLYLLTTTAKEYFLRLGFEPVSRDQVSAAVRQSVEFTSACPSSAQAMLLRL